MSEAFEFIESNPPKQWTGRYSRIPGQKPVFHVNTRGLITIQWFDNDCGEQLTAPIVKCPAATKLGAALNRAKAAHTGHAGGSFAITEFGVVVCPIRESLTRYCVGRIRGVPTFRDPRMPGQIFDLKPDPKLQLGSPWTGPYLGMKFNLSGNDKIYFQQQGPDGSHTLWPAQQDEELIRKLRLVRPAGKGIRFIVNLHGAVFTKVEPDWRPVFVGYINPKRWFTEECC